MAIQFMFSPDGMGVGAQAANAPKLIQRGIYGSGTAFDTVPYNSRVALRLGGSSAVWTFAQSIAGAGTAYVGARVSTPTFSTNLATEGIRVQGQVTYLVFRLLPTGNLRVQRLNGLLGDVPCQSGDYFEAEITATTVSIYINNAVTPAATFTFASIGAFVSVDFYRGGFDVSDLYVSSTRMGEVEVRLAPSVSAATTGTLVGGTAAQAVSFDTTTAYASLEPGQTLTSNVGGSITDNPQSIKAVQVTALGRKSGTALLPEKVLVTTPAGTEEIEPAIPLGLGFGAQSLVMATDPNDSAAWTKAKVNGLIVGGKG